MSEQNRPAPAVGRLLILWSPPRCRSTLFLRMIMERGDFRVVHEPLSHVTDFGESMVLDRVCRTPDEVIEALLAAGQEGPVFAKDTTDFHYPAVLKSGTLLTEAAHVFLIRDPQEAIASHYRLNPALTSPEVGFARVREIYDAVADATGTAPPVLDSVDLVRSPHALVRRFCAAVGIPFLPAALTWQPRVLPAWSRAPRWHEEVARSVGIEPPPDTAPDSDIAADHVLSGLLRDQLPHYAWLRERRLML